MAQFDGDYDDPEAVTGHLDRLRAEVDRTAEAIREATDDGIGDTSVAAAWLAIRHLQAEMELRTFIGAVQATRLRQIMEALRDRAGGEPEADPDDDDPWNIKHLL